MAHLGANPSRLQAPVNHQEEAPLADCLDIFDEPVPSPNKDTSTAEPAPAPTAPAIIQEPQAAATDTPAEEKKKNPSSKSDKPSSGKKPKKSPKEQEEDDITGKEKYSIYLPPKLGLALRMVYTITRKKYSHITETALTDMLFNRYRCEEPNCMVLFSMSETDRAPSRCPCCGSRRISPLRIDLLD